MMITTQKIIMVKEKTTRYDGDMTVNKPRAVADLLRAVADLHEAAEEQLWMVCLDIKCKPVGVHLVSVGLLDQALGHPREIYKRAIANNAHRIIIAHNHPSGDITPSSKDDELTVRLKAAGELLGIALFDHLIIGDDNHHSYKQAGRL